MPHFHQWFGMGYFMLWYFQARNSTIELNPNANTVVGLLLVANSNTFLSTYQVVLCDAISSTLVVQKGSQE